MSAERQVPRSLVEVVQAFRGLRALVVGDVMLDTYLEGTAARLCSEGPVPVVRKTDEQRSPGGAANTAANLRALGADVDLLGVVGNDAAGGELRSVLRERDIDDRWVVGDANATTHHKLRILADDHYVVRLDDGETSPLAVATEERLVAHLDALHPHCDVVVVSDYRYGVLSNAVVSRLRALQRARQTVLVVDSKQLARFRDLGATVVTPNHLEARLAVETNAAIDGRTRIPDAERIGRRLLATIESEFLAMTLGRDGVLVLDRAGNLRHLPAHPVPRANDVGAGDSFSAALALAMAAGATCVSAARIGTDAAWVAVTKRRTAVVTQQELLQRVALRDAADVAGIDEARPPFAALARLAARLDGDRLIGRTIVFTNGVFDRLHAGHVRFLREAKSLGDVLVVGINSDRGAHCPANNEWDRLALVAALDPVDHAILFDEETPAETIRALRPHLHVIGGDYAGEALPEASAVRDVGGRIVILPLAGPSGTTGGGDPRRSSPTDQAHLEVGA